MISKLPSEFYAASSAKTNFQFRRIMTRFAKLFVVKLLSDNGSFLLDVVKGFRTGNLENIGLTGVLRMLFCADSLTVRTTDSSSFAKASKLWLRALHVVSIV